MKAATLAGTALLVLSNVGTSGVLACGDKFLMVGRGVRFQRAYAAIHPASILLVVPPKSVKDAAVRDSRLHSALKMAGHKLAVVSPSDVAVALTRSGYDIVLAEQADALTIQSLVPPDIRKPAVIGVQEARSSTVLPAAQPPFDAVLKAPQSIAEILKLLDDVMTTRLVKART